MSKDEILENYAKIKNRIKECSSSLESCPELLVVSKRQTEENIRLLHDRASQQTFGENYVHELLGKSKNLPKSIKWHFIGHLQTNKVKALLSVDNLEVVETVDSIKLAEALNKACKAQGRPVLKVMIQVKTSNETSKSGAQLSEALDILKYIASDCESLKFIGLMTMGDADVENARECFKKMVNLREIINEKISEFFGVESCSFDCKLSMGTTRDLEVAIQSQSSQVRVGSAIFGEK